VRRLGAGPPLLLVHGLMTSSYSFRYVLAPLGSSFTCYAVDLPGAGATEPALSTSYDAASLGRFLVGVQRALGIEGCACFANSMGGYVAMVCALDHPGAFSRLTNLHSPGLPEPRLWALAAALATPGARWLLHSLVQRDPIRFCHKNVHYYDESLKSLEEAQTYAAPLRRHEGREALRKYLRETMSAAAMSRFVGRLEDRRARSEPFPIPLQLVYARQDPMVPPRIGAALAKLIPDARFAWLDEASHFAHVDAVERLLPVIEPFLGEDARTLTGPAPTLAGHPG
jgi:pimeloyl-ACP methyl ester carboxylesterase